MSFLSSYLTQPHHLEMVEELMALSTAEDRLSFLMERSHLHAPLEPAERVADRKVPGCLSGLWLKGEMNNGQLHFSAFSESDLVHGVVSYICDLYSQRSPEEILQIGSAITDSLKLDGLLSTTRKRAVSSTLAFIQHSARTSMEEPLHTSKNAA
jgi:cysteine desulfuration protein SufE